MSNFKAHIVLHLRYIQKDINVLLRTSNDKKKICELREKRDLILNSLTSYNKIPS